MYNDVNWRYMYIQLPRSDTWNVALIYVDETVKLFNVAVMTSTIFFSIAGL